MNKVEGGPAQPPVNPSSPGAYQIKGNDGKTQTLDQVYNAPGGIKEQLNSLNWKDPNAVKGMAEELYNMFGISEPETAALPQIMNTLYAYHSQATQSEASFFQAVTSKNAYVPPPSGNGSQPSHVNSMMGGLISVSLFEAVLAYLKMLASSDAASGQKRVQFMQASAQNADAVAATDIQIGQTEWKEGLSKGIAQAAGGVIGAASAGYGMYKTASASREADAMNVGLKGDVKKIDDATEGKFAGPYGYTSQNSPEGKAVLSDGTTVHQNDQGLTGLDTKRSQIQAQIQQNKLHATQIATQQTQNITQMGGSMSTIVTAVGETVSSHYKLTEAQLNAKKVQEQQNLQVNNSMVDTVNKTLDANKQDQSAAITLLLEGLKAAASIGSRVAG